MNNEICQSCGMPLKDAKDYGTYSDGIPCESYCHYCFVEGLFTDQGITLKEKIAKNIEMAVGMGTDPDEATNLAKQVLPTLRRWQFQIFNKHRPKYLVLTRDDVEDDGINPDFNREK